MASRQFSRCSLRHAAALQGHDADTMRSELDRQLAPQGVDRAERNTRAAAGVIADGVRGHQPRRT